MSGAGRKPPGKPPGKSPGRALVPHTGYEVGYGKPPVGSRFKPGQSGNPRGRPKGANTRLPALNEERMKSIILEEAYRGITVRDGDRNVSVPIAQAVLRSLAINAVKGQHRAQRLFAELLAATERQNKALADEWLDVAMTYKIEWERELARRDRFGITDLPPPLPHPDHVKIDMRRGTARVVGPSTKEEKVEYDMWIERRCTFEAELEELRADLAAEKSPRLRKVLETEIGQTERVLEIIDNCLPD